MTVDPGEPAMLDRVSSFAASPSQDDLIQQMQSRIAQLTNEISSGRKTDPAGVLGAGAAALYQLHYGADQQSALQTGITTAADRLDAVQTSLTSLSSVVQTISSAALNSNSAQEPSVLATQAQDAMGQVTDLLNTRYAGQSVFAGDDSATTPMTAPDAAGGPLTTVNSVLSTAVATKGGPLSAADIPNLIDGTNGLSSVFDDTNADPTQRYSSAFYVAKDDGKPTTVAVGTTQTVSYNAQADQPAFRDLLKGLSMLSLLGAPSSQMDDTAKSALLQAAQGVISTAQGELTQTQATLGIAQSQLQQSSDAQKAASQATLQQITGIEQADPYADATQLDQLQTQLQASYEVTAEISQLSFVNFFTPGG
jgi:flagellar hook-associated protein 3 FlgL